MLLNKFSYKKLLPAWIILLIVPGFTVNQNYPGNYEKTNSIPAGYYDSASGKTGVALNNALHQIIKNHTKFPYTSTSTDVWDILMDTDEDTTNANNVILLYSGRSQDKSLNGSLGPDGDYWNREHVWSKSHGFPNESDTAYTDVHHLRPCDASINSSRSNKDFDNGGTAHSEATGCFSDSDSWEPRDEVKGDVARMMFYMEVRYENDGNYDLELQESIPSSGPNFAKLSVLQAWHQQDPVDNWEIIRNDKIFGYQGNRNPFIDHPEYVDLIWGSSGVKGEPTNHANSFSASPVGTTINLSWTDAIGDTLPDFYLIKASTVNFAAINDPTDATSEADDEDLSDGGGAKNVSYGVKSFSFTNLNPNTTYYFKIYSYSNSASNINYKTDGTIETTSALSGEASETADDLFISEYVEGSSGSNKYLEIYNGTGGSVDLGIYDIQIYFNGSTSAGTTISLSGTILQNDAFVIAHSSATNWPGSADLSSGSLSFNGNDAVVLRKNSSDLDIIGQIGNGSNLYNDRTLQRSSSVTGPVAIYNSSEWSDLAESYDDLGQHTFDSALPVELISFRGNYFRDQIALVWQTASEVDNAGFILEKSENNGPFHEIASWRNNDDLVGLGTSSQSQTYTFTDFEIREGDIYIYRLWDEDFAGSKQLNAEITVVASIEIKFVDQQFLPESTSLLSNYPNPFNPITYIPFELVKATSPKILIHDIQGRLIKEFLLGDLGIGRFEITWDGTNNLLQHVSSGIYIYTLVTENFNQSRRMLLLR